MLSDFQRIEYGIIRNATDDLQEMLDSNVDYTDFNSVMLCCDRIINACEEIKRYANNKQIINMLKDNPFKEA